MLNVTWKRNERGPRGGGAGITVCVNGLPAAFLPDSPQCEELAKRMSGAADSIALRCAIIAIRGDGDADERFGKGRYSVAVDICREFGIELQSLYQERSEQAKS